MVQKLFLFTCTIKIFKLNKSQRKANKKNYRDKNEENTKFIDIRRNFLFNFVDIFNKILFIDI